MQAKVTFIFPLQQTIKSRKYILLQYCVERNAFQSLQSRLLDMNNVTFEENKNLETSISPRTIKFQS